MSLIRVVATWAALIMLPPPAIAHRPSSPHARRGGESSAQDGLTSAAEEAARAWLAHDATALVGRSQALVLQIPGADPSAALGRAQAIELLRRHFQSATERTVAVATTREVEAGRGVVELDRQYVVRGTTDQRRESVFLGFRLVQGQWILAEVRTAQ